MKVLVDGKIVNRSDVKVDIEDRGYQFGDGVYEVINIYNGVPFTLEEHIARLYRSASEIGLTIKQDNATLKNLILQVIQANEVKSGGLYLQLSRGVAPRTHQYKADIQPRLVAYPLPLKEMKQMHAKGVSVITEEDLRWLRCDIKSLNLLYNVMIKQKADKAGAFEAILIRDGIVTEGTSSNAFIIKNKIIYTHPVSNLILNGITRIKLLQIFEQKDWQYKEQAFTKQDLLDADEVFVTSTTSEVVPVISINGATLNDGKPGSLTKEIQQAFSATVDAETSKPMDEVK